MKSNEEMLAGILSRTVDVIRREHKSIETEKAYCGWIRRFFWFCLKVPKSLPPERKLELFLTDLARVQDVSASTQNGAFHAVRFLYVKVLEKSLDVARVNALRATRPEQIRKAPTLEETVALLRTVQDVSGYPSNLAVRLMYGCGLRVSEPLALRIKEVRISRMELYILGAKGRKDRVVRLPDCLVPEIERQMTVAQTVFEQDRRNGVPVELPHGLARKYPDWRFAWPCAWLFPMHRPCRHPRTGETVRWHMIPDIVQRAVKLARRALGIMVRPHELRHGYATHSLDAGVNIKALQEALGHVQLETTAGYCHAEALSVRSPLDALEGAAAGSAPVRGKVLAFEPGRRSA